MYITVLTVIGYKSQTDTANDGSPCGGVGILGVAWAFGGMIFVLVYCTAGISGRHINPAVTFGLFLARKVSLIRAFSYMVVQCIWVDMTRKTKPVSSSRRQPTTPPPGVGNSWQRYCTRDSVSEKEMLPESGKLSAAQSDDVVELNFKETELTLALPGESHGIKTGNCEKVGVSGDEECCYSGKRPVAGGKRKEVGFSCAVKVCGSELGSSS